MNRRLIRQGSVSFFQDSSPCQQRDSSHRSQIAPAYTMPAMAYFGEKLGMSTEIRDEVLSRDAHKAWDWNRGEDKSNS